MRSTFDRFDVDRTGKITADNLRAVLGKGFEGEAPASLIKEADTDGDGVISWEEFVEYLQKSHDVRIQSPTRQPPRRRDWRCCGPCMAA